MIVEELEIPIYERQFTVIVGSDEKELTDYFKKHGAEDLEEVGIDPEYLFCVTIDGVRVVNKREVSCIYVVLNPDLKDQPITYGIIAHEALHSVDFMQRTLGITHDVSNPEPTAYLLGWFVNQITRVLHNNKIKISLG